MAIKYINPLTGAWDTLTDKQIKQELLMRLGITITPFDIPTAEQNAEYKRQLNLFGNKLRNYKFIGGSNQLRANEELLRILRKEQNGQELTSEQQLILSLSSTTSSRFQRTLQQNESNLQFQRLSVVEAKFSGFLRKVPAAAVEWRAFLNENLYIIEATGEIVTVPPTDDSKYIVIKRGDIVTTKEAEDFLALQAKDFHKYQDAVYRQNKAFYKYNRRNVGTP